MQNVTSTEVVAVIGGVISVAAYAMALLPQGKPGTTWYVVRGVIDLLAANFGNAKNAPPRR